MALLLQNGFYINIEREKYESMFLYIKRCQLIEKHKPKTESEFININKLTKLWVNWKYNNILYPSEVMVQLELL